MKKMIISILAILAILIIGLVVTRNIIARMVIEKGVKAATGLRADIKGVNIGLMSPGISVSGLTIYNPEGFSDKVMAEINQIYVDLDLQSFFKSIVHVRMLKLDIKEIAVIMNQSAKLNVSKLAIVSDKPKDPKQTGSKQPEVKIDTLTIKIGKVSYKGDLPVVGVKAQDFELGFDETFNNVSDPREVSMDILKKIFKRLGIAQLSISDLKGAGLDNKGKAQQNISDLLQKTKEDLGGVLSK